MLPKSITLGISNNENWHDFFVCFYIIHFLEIKLRNFSLLINRHKVIRVVPQTEEQLRFLLKLQEGTYDFWSSPSKLDAPVDIRVSPQR